MRKPVEFNEERPAVIQIPFGPYRAVVKHWIDGDTLDCFIDMGLSKYAYETIRVAGMNAPEIYGRKEPGELERGKAALAYALVLAPIGTQVVLQTYKDRTSFGRYVADITLPDGEDFATQMVTANQAQWWKDT